MLVGECQADSILKLTSDINVSLSLDELYARIS